MAARERLSDHPMLKRIIQAHLGGQSSREIADWVLPRVSHSTISRYTKLRVDTVMEKADAITLLLNPNRDANIGLMSPLQAVSHALDSKHEAKQMTVEAIMAAPVLAIRDSRIKAKEERHRRLSMIVEERAADMATVPGGASGLLWTDYKADGTPVHKFDGALVQAFEEAEKNIAIELGQWQESASPNVSIQILCPSAPTPELAPRVSYASDDAIEASFEDIGLLQKP